MLEPDKKMPYQASVYNLMIASPSDVEAEREIVRDVVHQWNAVHASDRKSVLIPLGWETHTTPEMGDRPQSIINKQILRDADILVAVFWTRIGSPTGKYDSGTIEEIEEHIAAGKPAMLYFSSVPVRPDSVDEKQYAALRKFKAECQSRGLYESYETTPEFREKVTRQIAQTIIKLVADSSPEHDLVDVFERALTDEISISADARELLKAGAADRHGRTTVMRAMAGTMIKSNDRQFNTDGASPSDVARWTAAIDELEANDLVRDKGHKGEVYGLTHSGFEYARQMGIDAGGEV